MHNNDLSINFKKFAPEDFIITDNDYEIEVGLYHDGRFFNGKIICKDRAISIIDDYDDNIMSTEPVFYHIISPDIEAVSSYDYSEEELLGNEVPIFDADHIPEMLDSMKRTKKCDRNRPYNGQPHTIEGIRGSHIVVGLTDRDICDCAALALMIAAPGNSDHYAMADKWTNDMTQPAEWSWEDLYSLDLTYMDPVAFLQNLSCHLEMYQGIFPNLAKGLSDTLFNNSDITKEKPEPPKNILIMEGATLQPLIRKEE